MNKKNVDKEWTEGVQIIFKKYTVCFKILFTCLYNDIMRLLQNSGVFSKIYIEIEKGVMLCGINIL